MPAGLLFFWGSGSRLGFRGRRSAFEMLDAFRYPTTSGQANGVINENAFVNRFGERSEKSWDGRKVCWNGVEVGKIGKSVARSAEKFDRWGPNSIQLKE